MTTQNDTPATDTCTCQHCSEPVASAETITVRVDDGTEDGHARWLLAQLLSFHRREDRATWGALYQLDTLSDAELVEDRTAIGGLRFEGEVGTQRRILYPNYYADQGSYWNGVTSYNGVTAPSTSGTSAVAVADRVSTPTGGAGSAHAGTASRPTTPRVARPRPRDWRRVGIGRWWTAVFMPRSTRRPGRPMTASSP